MANIGRPRVFKEPEEFHNKILDYFDWVDEENIRRKEEGEKFKPYTITSLCLYLGIWKEAFYEYAKRPEYANSYKMARNKIESQLEEGMLNGTFNTIGAIFNAKNNFGWTDKQEITVSKPDEVLTADDIKKTLSKKSNKLLNSSNELYNNTDNDV